MRKEVFWVTSDGVRFEKENDARKHEKKMSEMGVVDRYLLEVPLVTRAPVERIIRAFLAFVEANKAERDNV